MDGMLIAMGLHDYVWQRPRPDDWERDIPFLEEQERMYRAKKAIAEAPLRLLRFLVRPFARPGPVHARPI